MGPQIGIPHLPRQPPPRTHRITLSLRPHPHRPHRHRRHPRRRGLPGNTLIHIGDSTTLARRAIVRPARGTETDARLADADTAPAEVGVGVGGTVVERPQGQRRIPLVGDTPTNSRAPTTTPHRPRRTRPPRTSSRPDIAAARTGHRRSNSGSSRTTDPTKFAKVAEVTQGAEQGADEHPSDIGVSMMIQKRRHHPHRGQRLSLPITPHRMRLHTPRRPTRRPHHLREPANPHNLPRHTRPRTIGHHGIGHHGIGHHGIGHHGIQVGSVHPPMLTRTTPNPLPQRDKPPDMRRKPTPLPHRVPLRTSPLPHHPRIQTSSRRCRNRRRGRGRTRRSKPELGLSDSPRLGHRLGIRWGRDGNTSPRRQCRPRRRRRSHACGGVHDRAQNLRQRIRSDITRLHLRPLRRPTHHHLAHGVAHQQPRRHRRGEPLRMP